MPPKSKDTRVRLLEPLATEFAAFRAALGLGATEIGVIREAVKMFIAARCAKDDDLRARYEEELARAHKAQPLRLIKLDDRPK